MKKGGSRKRRRVAPRVDGGAGQLTAHIVRSLRWADGLLGDGQSHLVLADSRPFRRGELVAAWWGDGAHQGWRTLHIEDVDGGGVRRAIWLRSGKRVSNQIRRLLSAGHMRCLRCLPVAEDEEDEEEEEEEEQGSEGSSAAGSAAGSSEGGSEGGGSAAGGSEGSSAAGLAGGSEGGQTREEVVSIDDRPIREEADMITEGGMQVDSRYWCVDAPVDWSRLDILPCRLIPNVGFWLLFRRLSYDLPRRPLSPPRPNSSPTALKLGGPPRGVPPALSTAPGLPQLGSWLLFRRLPSDIPGTFDK